VFVVGTKIGHSMFAAAVVALGTLILLFGLQYGLPFVARRRNHPTSPAGRPVATSP
jgi:hypothetical protein